MPKPQAVIAGEAGAFNTGTPTERLRMLPLSERDCDQVELRDLQRGP